MNQDFHCTHPLAPSSLHFLFPALRKIDLVPPFKFPFIFPLFFFSRKKSVARKHRRERTVPSVQFNSTTHRTRWWTAANSPAPFARSVTTLSTPLPRTSNRSPSAATSFTSFGKALLPSCVFPPLVDTNAVEVPFSSFWFGCVCLQSAAMVRVLFKREETHLPHLQAELQGQRRMQALFSVGGGRERWWEASAELWIWGKCWRSA